MKKKKKIDPRPIMIVVMVMILALIGFRVVNRAKERMRVSNPEYQKLAANSEKKSEKERGGVREASKIEAAEKLIAPYKFGGVFADGLRFTRLEKSEGGNIIIKLSGKSGGRGYFLWLSERDESKTAMARTRNYNIICIAENKKGLDEEDRKTADALIELVGKNDGGSAKKVDKPSPSGNRAIAFGSECEGVDRKSAKFDKAELRIAAGGAEPVRVSAEIAESAAARCVGLAGRRSLAPEAGMLFVFEGEGKPSFSVREIAFPVDMIYIGANGEIVGVENDIKAGTQDIKTPEASIKYALEVNGGFAASHGIKAGDRMKIPEGR
ncbi:MAG: DUF192 domain-containing protein [bacterium]